MDKLDEILYLSRFDVNRLNLSMEKVIEIVEEAFLQKAVGKVEVPPKPGIHPKNNSFIHAMPAYLQRIKSAGIKWISGFPGNTKKGLPYISGVLILNDVETGFPICIMDCTWITAKRTGAATAVAAKHLARKDSQIFTILGCGIQGRSNLEALLVVFKDLETVHAYDTNKGNLHKYISDMTKKYGLKIIPASSPKKALKECDIAVTAGPILKNPSPVIEASWVKEGVFACPLDFDSYWKPEAIHSMDKFCTDDKSQLNYYKKQCYFRDIPPVFADLSEIVSGLKLGREDDKERVMSMNLGLAIEDIATASYIYKKAKRKGVGRGMRRGRGLGRGQDWPLRIEQSPPIPPPIEEQQASAQAASPRTDELAMLKQQSQSVQRQIGTVTRRIRELAKTHRRDVAKRSNPVAQVDDAICTGCGICAEVCPQAAIKVNTIAEVDAAICAGCGICVQHCPNKALILAV